MHESNQEVAITLTNSLSCSRPPSFVILTLGVVNVRTAYLVHQQHKHEAEDQRHSDVGVELLVAVLVFPAGTESCLHFHLCLRCFRDSNLTIAVMA